MPNIFVVDTVALINYYNKSFDDLFIEEDKISNDARQIIAAGFDPYSDVKLSIPSVVFIEIHYKFLNTEEKIRKFKYIVFKKIWDSEDIEIKSIEKEVLENFALLDDSIVELEHNDKLVLSSAMQLNCPLITIDTEIIKYVNRDKVIPKIIV